MSWFDYNYWRCLNDGTINYSWNWDQAENDWILKVLSSKNFDNVWKDEKDCWKHTLNAPGINKDWLKLQLQDVTLTLEYKPPKDMEKSDFYFSTPFSYFWTIPKDVKIEDVSAQYKNGIMVLKIKKPVPKEPPKHVIPIQY